MRRVDWVSRLWDTMNVWHSANFDYGHHDCCLFAARCIDAITGTDREKELLTQYHDERTAMRFIAKSGGIVPAISERLGEPVDGYCARRGDVCLVPTENGDGVGVCVGTTVAVAAETGLEFYPLSTTIKHWRID